MTLWNPNSGYLLCSSLICTCVINRIGTKESSSELTKDVYNKSMVNISRIKQSIYWHIYHDPCALIEGKHPRRCLHAWSLLAVCLWSNPGSGWLAWAHALEFNAMITGLQLSVQHYVRGCDRPKIWAEQVYGPSLVLLLIGPTNGNQRKGACYWIGMWKYM